MYRYIYIYAFLQCLSPVSVELLDLGFLDFRASLATMVPLWVLWGKSGNRSSQRHTTAPKCKSYLEHPHARDREPHTYNTKNTYGYVICSYMEQLYIYICKHSYIHIYMIISVYVSICTYIYTCT